MGSGWRGELSPLGEDEARQEVKSQHLSLSQLLQVRGSCPRLSPGEGREGWGLRCRDRGLSPVGLWGQLQDRHPHPSLGKGTHTPGTQKH